MIEGAFRPGGHGREWCDADVLGSIRRRSLARLREAVEPVEAPVLGKFLVTWHGIGRRRGGLDALLDTIEQLQGVPLVASLLEHDPAGIILSPAEGSDAARLRPLLASRTPMLVFNRTLGEEWDYLALDNAHGARLATQHLLSQGHRRIAFFGGHGDSSSCFERREGWRAALADAGVSPEPQWIVECAPTR